MNVSYRWLRNLAPALSGTPHDLAARITQLAVPVDEVVDLARGLEDVVVARVARVRPHPNADHLVLCEVQTGDGVAQVVTGAPNVVEGAFYPFVAVGGTLPGGVAIQRVKLRGVWSDGMLCSERELGLGRDATGIMRLSGTFEVGAPLVKALGLDDHRLVIDVTANRPDLLGHWGVARELARGGVRGLCLAPFPDHVSAQYDRVAEGAEAMAGGVPVRIEDRDGCPRYMALVLRGVQVGPSPEWLASRLRAVGARPINNVVDATNYVLFELNQPLHAFDLAKLRGPAIVVCRARPGERIRTLDGVDRELNPEVLVIADAERPVAVAGVIGGAETEVSEATTDLLIECAYFEPKRIRRGARSLGVETDASYRFQRGIDPEGLPAALRRVADLILSVAGGVVQVPAADAYPNRWTPRVLRLRPERVSLLLGAEIGRDEIAAELEPLGMDVRGSGGPLEVTVPSWRPDISREVDLIEEVARRWGYDRFPEELRPFRLGRTGDDRVVRAVSVIRRAMVEAGFLEARSVPFVAAGVGEIPLANPLAEDEAYLRRWLLPGLVDRVEHNFARLVRNVRLVEVGTVFVESGGPLPREEMHVAAVWTGRREPPHWTGEKEWDVWDLKGLLEAIAPHVVGPSAFVRPLQPGSEVESALPFQAGSFAVVTPDGGWMGGGGQVRPDAIDAPRWAGPVWGFEMRLAEVEAPARRYSALPSFPAVERDLALLVPLDCPAAAVGDAIRGSAPETLESLSLFDVYTGPNVPADRRSLAWRLRFRAGGRTLTDAEVDAAVKVIIRTLEGKLDVTVRGA